MIRQPFPASRRTTRLFAGLLVPLIFVVLLQLLGNATTALAITEGLPLLWVISYGIWRRRIEPVGTAAVAGLGIALLLTIALGDSPLPLELHRALFPGTVGLACLISLAVRHPLLGDRQEQVCQQRTRSDSQVPTSARGPRRAQRAHRSDSDHRRNHERRCCRPGHSRAHGSTATFGVVAHIAAWVIVGSGLAVCGLYLRTTVRRDRDGIGTAAPESTRSSHSPPPPTVPTEMPR